MSKEGCGHMTLIEMMAKPNHHHHKKEIHHGKHNEHKSTHTKERGGGLYAELTRKKDAGGPVPSGAFNHGGEVHHKKRAAGGPLPGQNPKRTSYTEGYTHPVDGRGRGAACESLDKPVAARKSGGPVHSRKHEMHEMHEKRSKHIKRAMGGVGKERHGEM